MAIAFNDTTTTDSITTTWNGSSFDSTLSKTLTSGANLISVRLGGGGGAVTVTWNGTALTQRLAQNTGNSDTVRLLDLVTPDIGTYDLVIDSGGSGRSFEVITSSLSGVDTGTPVSTSDSASGFAANKSVTLTTNTDDMVLDVLASEGQTATVGAGQTQDLATTNNIAASYEASTTTSTTMSWTHAACWSAIASVAYAAASLTEPTITDFDTDEDVYPGQTAATITGTNFEAVKGTGAVTASPTDNVSDTNAETQTTTSWADLSIDVTVTQGGLPFGASYLFVTNDGGEANALGFAFTLSSDTGKANVTLIAVDSEGLVNNFTGLAIGDQIEYETTSTQSGTVVVNTDGTFEITYGGAVPDTDSFDARAWDETDYTWTAFDTININNVTSTSPPGGVGLARMLKARRK